MATTNTRSPTDIDKEVGGLIRLARKQAKMSQTDLGQAVGVTYQQVQKYENGTDRVAVSRLVQMAQVMGVPVNTLLPGEDQSIGGLQPEEIDLLATYRQVKPGLQPAVAQIAKNLTRI